MCCLSFESRNKNREVGRHSQEISDYVCNMTSSCCLVMCSALISTGSFLRESRQGEYTLQWIDFYGSGFGKSHEFLIKYILTKMSLATIKSSSESNNQRYCKSFNVFELKA